MFKYITFTKVLRGKPKDTSFVKASLDISLVLNQVVFKL